MTTEQLTGPGQAGLGPGQAVEHPAVHRGVHRLQQPGHSGGAPLGGGCQGGQTAALHTAPQGQPQLHEGCDHGAAAGREEGKGHPGEGEDIQVSPHVDDGLGCDHQDHQVGVDVVGEVLAGVFQVGAAAEDQKDHRQHRQQGHGRAEEGNDGVKNEVGINVAVAQHIGVVGQARAKDPAPEGGEQGGAEILVDPALQGDGEGLKGVGNPPEDAVVRRQKGRQDAVAHRRPQCRSGRQGAGGPGPVAEENHQQGRQEQDEGVAQVPHQHQGQHQKQKGEQQQAAGAAVLEGVDKAGPDQEDGQQLEKLPGLDIQKSQVEEGAAPADEPHQEAQKAQGPAPVQHPAEGGAGQPDPAQQLDQHHRGHHGPQPQQDGGKVLDRIGGAAHIGLVDGGEGEQDKQGHQHRGGCHRKPPKAPPQQQLGRH